MFALAVYFSLALPAKTRNFPEIVRVIQLPLTAALLLGLFPCLALPQFWCKWTEINIMPVIGLLHARS